jgi:hypothetical protein
MRFLPPYPDGIALSGVFSACRPWLPASLFRWAGFQIKTRRGYLTGFLLSLLVSSVSASPNQPVLKPSIFSHYIERFNSMEDENITNAISNAESAAWLAREIPLFDCPDREVEEIYYFRWLSFR